MKIRSRRQDIAAANLQAPDRTELDVSDAATTSRAPLARLPVHRRQPVVLCAAVLLAAILVMPVPTGALSCVTEVQRQRRCFDREETPLFQELRLGAGARARQHAHRVVRVPNAMDGNALPLQHDTRLKLLAEEPSRKIKTHGNASPVATSVNPMPDPHVKMPDRKDRSGLVQTIS